MYLMVSQRKRTKIKFVKYITSKFEEENSAIIALIVNDFSQILQEGFILL